MIGTEASVGIGVIGGESPSASSSSGGSGEPEVFTPAQNDTVVNLSKAAKKVVVIHNGITQNQITGQVPAGSFTHVTNTTAVTFNFNLDAGDVVIVIPFY